ncbi:potassium/proton antiporter [Stackebrandtia soli]|uniref:potassium/proton antiporter n=1 Tax=Stackebrandtia soli TaxID=1892856 RepID=UPI0039E7A771
MSLHELSLMLLIGGGVLLVCIAAVTMFNKVGLPALLAFLLLGTLLGDDAIGFAFHDVEVIQPIAMVALALILIEGGFSTRWRDIRPILLPASVLATVGVGISIGLTAVATRLLLDWDWRMALLVGAIIASTDAAAVFSVLRNLRLPRRVAGLLEAESGFNDAPTVILVLAFSVHTEAESPLLIVLDLAYQLAGGAVIGIVVGWAGAWGARRIALPVAGLYPLGTVGLGIIAFAAAGTIDASGFLAAYLAALVLGNSRLPHQGATLSFAQGTGWLAQIGLFVILGMLVELPELLNAVVPALVIGAALLLVARPIAVALTLTPFRIAAADQAFIAWAGLRGAVPIVLATIPIVADVDGSAMLLNVVFVLVIIFTVVQGPSLQHIARWLGLATHSAFVDVDIDSAPLDVLGAGIMTVTIGPRSGLHGLYLYELRLPERSVVNSIVRDGQLFVPGQDERLRSGDELMIITMRGSRDATEARLRAVARRGRLAGWYGEYGAE